MRENGFYGVCCSDAMPQVSWEHEKDSCVVYSEFYDSESSGLSPRPFVFEIFPSFPESIDARGFEDPSEHFLETSFCAIVFNLVACVHNQVEYASLP